MRSHLAPADAVAAFTLTCPGYRGNSGSGRHPGVLSFTICDTLVAEIDGEDLIESWRAAASLTPVEARRMSAHAGSQLADILASGLPAADLTEAVTDAAVVFLLAMKNYGITDPKRIPACTVMWDGQDDQERVFLSA